MSESDESEYNEQSHAQHDLLSLISSVHSAGSFVAFGALENFSNPGVSVDPLGLVRLPLSEGDAHALVQASDQAPFGKGTETLVDESVRKTWQIDADKVVFQNKGWQRYLDQVVAKAAEGLGIAGGAKNVRAEFYKMLLYEKGAMFKPHKDTEKVPGMFGTLVICLPSEHTGGAISLKHETKTARVETSASSEFDATFIAWYADVTHEIEPVQTGYRWVLTYNLVNEFQAPDLSASVLDMKVDSFVQALTEWRDCRPRDCFFAYALEHRYTSKGLNLTQLKGNDYYRARHIAQSCTMSGEFYMLLANVVLEVVNSNCEDVEELEENLFLTRIVDLEGYGLSASRKTYAPKTAILQERLHANREPDSQSGGEYMGNQYAEIYQTFKDSAIVVVPKGEILSFLLFKNAKLGAFRILMKTLMDHMKNKSNRIGMENLIRQVCHICLSENFSRVDLIGPVAVAAAFLRDAALFTKAIGKIAKGFDRDSFSDLGELICLGDSVVSEDDIIDALKKSEKLHEICDGLAGFSEGFFRGNPDRHSTLQQRHLKRWIDVITCECLQDLKHTYAKDVEALIKIIVQRENENFRQFVLYQGVRTFIDGFATSKVLLNALLVEMLFHLEVTIGSRQLLGSLLRRILEAVTCNFDLQECVAYIRAHYDRILARNRSKDKSIRIEPIEVPDESVLCRLLATMQTQAPTLARDQLEVLPATLLHGMITVLGAPSPKAREYYQSLFDIYITGFVGKEPAEPSDWARPDEVKPACKENCDTCDKLNAFRKDPNSENHFFSGEEYEHLSWGRHDLHYFGIKFGDSRSASLTKTVDKWRSHHRIWESYGSAALSALQQLPQDRLKECVGNRYDEIMNLSVVKLGYGEDEAQSTSELDCDHGATPVIPQKRPLDEASDATK